jgi:hypothetical protein
MCANTGAIFMIFGDSERRIPASKYIEVDPHLASTTKYKD